MSSRIHSTLFLLSTLTLAACGSNPSSSPQIKPEGIPLESCSLLGKWSSCQSDGTQSQRITLTIASNSAQETIEFFGSSSNCSGSPDGAFDLNGSIVSGSIGASPWIEGATDVDVTFDQDIGCGAGNTAYTALQFTGDCQGFYIANTQPGCSPDQRGTALSTDFAFSKVSE